MRRKLLVAVALLAVAAAVLVERIMTGIQIRTVADVRSSDTRGGTVAVRGRIVYASRNRFILDDGSGRVELSTCPQWYRQIHLHEGDTVVAVGQVMNNPSLTGQSDFALSVYKLFHRGSVIEVRKRPGKPPWVSFPKRTHDSVRDGHP